MTKVKTVLAGESKRERFAYWAVRGTCTVFLRVWCRLTIEGRENLPKSGPFVLAPTHRSIIDTPVASSVRARRMRFMGADKWWSNRTFGKILTLVGGFPVTRGAADRQALERTIAVIEAGEPAVIFPEGERKSGPVVQPLFRGVAYMAGKTNVPVVPVGIGGSERAMPKGARFIYPSKIHVIVGAPIFPKVDGTGRVPRDSVRGLTDELHTEMQRLFDAAQARATR